MTFLILAGAYLLVNGFCGWRAVRNAPLVDDKIPIRYVSQEDVLITPQGVEIPLSWLACADDIDQVIATLYEIDQMGVTA